MDFEQILFETKTFSDVLKEIYTNSKEKSSKINELVEDLQPMIRGIGDATVMVPLIKDYLDVDVKNNELLIKMLTIAQKAADANKFILTDNDNLLSDEELKQLQSTATQLSPEELKQLESTTNQLSEEALEKIVIPVTLEKP